MPSAGAAIGSFLSSFRDFGKQDFGAQLSQIQSEELEERRRHQERMASLAARRKEVLKNQRNASKLQSLLAQLKEVQEDMDSSDSEGATPATSEVGKPAEVGASAAPEAGKLASVDISTPMEVESGVVGELGDRTRPGDTVRCGDAGSGDVVGAVGVVGDRTGPGDTVRCGDAGSGDVGVGVGGNEVANSSRVDGAASSSEVCLVISRPQGEEDELEDVEELLLGEGDGIGDPGEEGDGGSEPDSDSSLGTKGLFG
jgi:hypothetical protein